MKLLNLSNVALLCLAGFAVLVYYPVQAQQDNPFGSGDSFTSSDEKADDAEAEVRPLPAGISRVIIHGRGENQKLQHTNSHSQKSKPNVPVFWVDEHLASSDSNHTEKIRQVLRSPLNDLGLKLKDDPLSKVVSFVREQYKINVQLDLQALDDLGLSPDDSVTIDLRYDISLGSALSILLKQLDLTYVVADEVLLITSEDEALSRLTVAVYPVGDILAVKQAGHDRGEKQQSSDIGELINAIISTIASDTWVVNGGPEAEIQPLQPGLLLVSQTQDVHEQIQRLLSAIREAKQHEFAVPHVDESVRRTQEYDAAIVEAYRRQQEEAQERSREDNSEASSPTADELWDQVPRHPGGGMF